METADVTFDSSGLCTLSTGEKFYQVSLKKEEAGAQLGKITSDFASKFGLLTNDDLVNLFIHENLDLKLDEGFKDLFKKGVNFIKDVGVKFMTKLSEISKKIGGFFKGIFGSLKSTKKSVDKKIDKYIVGLVNKHKLLLTK